MLRHFILTAILILAHSINVQGQSLQADQQALDSLNQLLEYRLDNGLEDKETIQILKELHGAYTSKAPKKSAVYINRAMEIAVKIDDKSEIGTMYGYLGNLYRDLGLFSKALESHLRSLEMSREFANDTMIAFAMNDVGNIYYDMGQWDQAFRYYRGAEALSTEIGYLRSRAVSQNNIGLVHEMQGNYDSSLYYHQLALKDRQRLKDQEVIAHSNMYLGEDYRNLNLMEDAMVHFQRSLAIYESLENWDYIPSIMELIAETHDMIGDFEEAERYYLEAYKILEENNSHLHQANLNVTIGEFYHHNNKLDKAREQLDQAIQISREHGLLWEEIRASELLTQVQKESNEPFAAIETLEHTMQLRDSFNSLEFVEKVGLIEAQSALLEKEKELAIMQRENALREETLAARETTNKALYGIIIVVFTLALIVFYAFYQKARSNKVLQEKNRIIAAQNERISASNVQLKEAKELAEKYSAAKTEFLSNISHEFRTPMNGILGLTDVILDRYSHNPEERKTLESIRYSARYLLKILNEVLDLSKIESGKIDFLSESFNLHEMVDQLTETHRTRISKPVMLTSNISPQVPQWVEGDATRLYQVINNLVGNALKFTDQGFVKLDAEAKSLNEDEVAVTISISDTGVGITDEQLKTVFNRFEQGGSKIYKKYGGTGLGLSITKRLIEMQGGTLTAESEPEVGSTFTFEIPYKKVKQTDRDIEPIQHQEDRSRMNGKMHILYAEDNEINQYLLKQVLKGEPIELRVVNDGKEALEALQQSQYDVVLMDIQMPVMDGIEATRQIRQLNGSSVHSNIPIIGFTADVMVETKSEALQAGMNHVMVKPFNKDELIEVLSNYTQS